MSKRSKSDEQTGTRKKQKKKGLFGLPRSSVLFIVKQNRYNAESIQSDETEDSSDDASYVPENEEDISTKDQIKTKSEIKDKGKNRSKISTLKHINELPHELLLKIFSHIIWENGDVSKLRALSLVCKSWHEICTNRADTLWKRVNLSGKRIDLEKFMRNPKLSFIVNLNLSGIADLKSTHLSVILTQAKRVEALNISNCKKLGQDALKAIADSSLTIKSLDVSNLNVNLSPKNANELFKRLGKSLLSLNIANVKLGKGVLKTILVKFSF